MRLSEFKGNERIVQLLKQRPLPQSTLFTGPAGIGKKTLALCLAALRNCPAPESGDLCGHCPSCLKAATGNHPDILLFEPEKNLIRIDAMRRLKREAQFRPFQGKLRFFVIDEAEKMNAEAANAILKTLEEPPDTTRLVLITAHPHDLLPTIRSRCQTIRLQPLSFQSIESHLKKVGLGEEAARRAAFAEGSIGRALSLDLEQALSDRAVLLDLLEKWMVRPSFSAIFKGTEKPPLKGDLKDRNRVRQYLQLLGLLLEDLYFLRVGTPKRMVNRDCRDRLEALAAAAGLDWLRDFLYHVAQAQWELDHYVSPLMIFETLWLHNERAVPNAAATHR